MLTPLWTDPQFVDATGLGGLNAAFNSVSGSIAALGGELVLQAGLLQPEVMQITQSGFSITAVLPGPFAVLTSGGVVAAAHGTLTNQDTQTYSVNFTSLVPASGSVTAYLAAAATQIQQNPVPIPGPPPGHPSYNPNYQPTIGYATTVDSLALSAVTTAPNNTTLFELGRCTLTAGATGLTSFITTYQLRAATNFARPPLIVSGSSALTPAQIARFTIVPAVSGLSTTLPPAAQSTGLFAFMLNGRASWTVAASGNDSLFVSRTASGASSATIADAGSLVLWSNGAAWYATAVNGAQYTAHLPTSPLIGVSGGDITTVSPASGLIISGGLLLPSVGSAQAASLLGWTGGGFSSVTLGPGLSVSGNTLALPFSGTATSLVGWSGTGFADVVAGPGIGFSAAGALQAVFGGTASALAGWNGTEFSNIYIGNGLQLSGNALSAPKLIPSTTTSNVVGPSIGVSNTDFYVNLVTCGIDFPVTSPTGGFKLFVFAKVTWTAVTFNPAIPISIASLTISAFDNSYAYETLISSTPLLICGADGATSDLLIADFAGGYYPQDTGTNITLRVALNTAAFPISQINAIGTLRLTAIPA